MATWPSSLPAPSLDGYAYKPNDLTRRTEMSAGLPRARRVSVGKFGQVPINLKLTQAQISAFETWFYDPAGANAGVAWFEIMLKLPEGTVPKMCRFVGTYESPFLGNNRWQLTATLEVSHA